MATDFYRGIKEQAGIDRGRLGLASQELTNNYDLGYRGLGIQQQELGIKALAAQNSQTAAQWGNLFGGGGSSGGSTAPTASWDEYFAARDAARPGVNTGVADSQGRQVYRSV